MSFAREPVRSAPARSAPAGRGPGGERLPAGTRERMERALGHDFAAVRVHAGATGADRADSLDARAAAIGGDVFFARGEYRPGTADSDRLLGHELAHVVQQGGGDAHPPGVAGPLDPERAADAAADAVATGRVAMVAQPARPFGVPALQPKPRGGTTQPAKSWDDRVKNALAETDLAKQSKALTTLAQEALGTTYKVQEAGTSSPGKLDPADYGKAPILNVDVRLTSKKKRNGSPVGNVAGHTFGRGPSAQYSILGPLAIQPGGRAKVVMYADHELYHASHPAAGELETWTDTFTKHFLDTFGQQWAPLIQYYEAEKPDAQSKYPQREATITALDTYYRGLSDVPPKGEKNSDKRKFILWFRRRLHDRATTAFVKDLSAKTGITDTQPPDPTTTPANQ